MSIDGVFVHHLVDELSLIKTKKINKVININETDFLFNLSGKLKLLITANNSNSHMRITSYDIVSSNHNNNFYNNLKRHFEGNLIINISQFECDRVITLETIHFDELGFTSTVYLILEMFGRNTNLIICDSNFTIIDCLKKQMDFENSQRLIIQKNKYVYPPLVGINPFTLESYNDTIKLQGVSRDLASEIKINGLSSISNLKPNITKSDKLYFHAVDLYSISGEKTYFDSISLMLDTYFNLVNINSVKNNEQKLIETFLKKEIAKRANKTNKLEIELKNAIDNLKYESIGNLLSSYLYLVKKGMSSVTVYDYYNNNNEVTITLDPIKTPTENLNHYFNLYKKSKRAISVIESQIEIAHNDINYYEDILNQLEYNKNLDLKEIIEELGLTKKARLKPSNKRLKPNIITYNDIYGGIILVGKNNIQNNYLTHTLANKEDLFIHVKAIGGSHVILRSTYLGEDSIQLACDIAAYYSKYSQTNYCNVDVTKVKNVKKVPGCKGSFVTYNTYKTYFANPNYDLILKRIKSIK